MSPPPGMRYCNTTVIQLFTKGITLPKPTENPVETNGIPTRLDNAIFCFQYLKSESPAPFHWVKFTQ